MLFNHNKQTNMNAIELYIHILETQLLTMPNGYVRETVTACKELAEGINAMYENNNNNLSNPTNQD